MKFGNPYPANSRLHAYLSAFVAGDGRATYRGMVRRCLDMMRRADVEDDELRIRRDLNNQTFQWERGRWGLTVTKDDTMCLRVRSGRLVRGEHDRVRFTCTMVGDTPITPGPRWLERLHQNAIHARQDDLDRAIL